MPVKCPNCGATSDGVVCEFCKSPLEESEEMRSERKKLEALHDRISIADRETRERLLRSGYLPSKRNILIHAGFKCIPYIDHDQLELPSESAVKRLEIIVGKLRLEPATREVTEAISQFEDHLRRYKSDSDFDMVLGCLGIVIIVALAAAAIYSWLSP